MAGRVLIPTVSSRAARHMARSFTGAMPINYRGYEADDDTLATMSRSSMTRTGTGGSLTDPILAGSFSSVHYDSIYDSSEFSGQRNSIEVMRKRLKSHFMTPYQKYKHRGRKPWKLLLQLLKLLMVTVQIFLFASELFAVVDFLDDSKQAFSYLLLNDNDGADHAIYTKDQFYSQVRFSLKQYYHLQDIAVGTFGLPQNKDHTIKPMNICIYKYNDSHVDPENETYYINRQTTYSCRDLFPPNASDANMTAFITRNNLPLTFDSIISVMLMVDVRSLHVRKPPSRPACYKFNITIQFDNSNHDGQVPVTLEAKGEILNCSRYSTDVGDGMHDYQAMKTFRVFFDIFTILVCAASMCLCFRSIKRHMQLVKATRNFFNRELHDHLSYWDCLDLMNLWFILIVISDISAIVGSLLKMIINIRVTKADQLYSVCSMFLGTAVLLTWSGLLRYLGYLKKYNILLVTLKASAPSVLRFCVCGALLYFGYLFCGWIVLGPYHVKFRSLVTVSECMFSLINGDDMFPTFAEMGTRSYAVWVFSKFYLYTFISLFIYIVLSLFIGIISDTYERIKDWGHPPCTKLQRFVHGNTCQRCATECTDDMLDNGVGVGDYCADP